jgi:hypothetical protein
MYNFELHGMLDGYNRQVFEAIEALSVRTSYFKEHMCGSDGCILSVRLRMFKTGCSTQYDCLKRKWRRERLSVAEREEKATSRRDESRKQRVSIIVYERLIKKIKKTNQICCYRNLIIEQPPGDNFGML